LGKPNSKGGVLESKYDIPCIMIIIIGYAFSNTETTDAADVIDDINLYK
jgi:hypothetical protein